MRFVVLALAACLAGCGGGVGSTCDGLLDAYQSLADRCEGTAVTFTPTERTNYAASCEQLVTISGISNYGSQVAGCATVVRFAACNDLESALECTIKGTLPDGAPCGTGAQCAGGICTNATQPDPQSEITCGVCASFIEVGAACTSFGSEECDTNLTCVNGSCVANGHQGDPCDDADDPECGPNLICDSSGRCGPLPTLGASCPSSTCAEPFVCLNGTCGAASSEGGPCPTGEECAVGLVCNAMTSTCQKPIIAESGEACGSVNGQEVGCDGGLTCPNGTCVPTTPLEGPCVAGQGQCDFALVCVDGTCQIPDYSVCSGAVDASFE